MSIELTEASKKLIAYMQAKHGDKLKSMSFDQYQKAKKKAQDEMKVQSTEKRAVKKAAEPPKPVNAGEVQDRDVIVQMRKLSDYKPGKYKVRVSPKRSVSVHSDTARKVSAAHDALEKPNDKRKFRIQLLSRLRKLKEESKVER